MKAKIREIVLADCPGLIDSLVARLKYGNEHALRKRLFDLIDRMDESTRDIIGIDTGPFVEAIRNTRNYFTHWSEELKDDALQDYELVKAVEKLRVIASVVLFMELDMARDEINEAISKDPFIRHMRRLEHR
jgi:hypothetical protein